MAGTTKTKSRRSSKRSTKSSSSGIRTPPSSGFGPTSGPSTSAFPSAHTSAHAHGTNPNNPKGPSSSYGITSSVHDDDTTLYERLSSQPREPDAYARVPAYAVQAARAIDRFEDVFDRDS